MNADLCMNPTSADELRELSAQVFDLSFDPREDEELESRVRMACNAMMCGDGGPAFTMGMKPALAFIAQLLELRAAELEQLRPSYFQGDAQ